MTSAIPWMNQNRAAVATDPYWSSVGLLALNENGANTTTTFIDQSTAAQTLTAAGNAQWSTAQAPPNDTSSCLGDGTGDRVDTGSSASNKLYSTSTVEGFVRFIAKAAAMRVIVFRHSGGKVVGIILGSTGDSTKIELNHFGTGIIFSSAAGVIANDTWYHFELSTGSGTTTLYINGTSVGSGSAPFLNENITVGMMGSTTGFGGSELNGYLASVRLTPGVQRHTGNFTAPTPPFPTQ